MASFVSRLNPNAPPFNSVALVPSQFFFTTTPTSLPPACFLPLPLLYGAPAPPPFPCAPPTPPPFLCAPPTLPPFPCAPPAWQPFPCAPPPSQPSLYAPPTPTRPVAVYCFTSQPPTLPPSATGCRITEIEDDGATKEQGGDETPKSEVGDEPSPRSVLTAWRRKPTSRLPPKQRVELPSPRPTSLLPPKQRVALPSPRPTSLLPPKQRVARLPPRRRPSIGNEAGRGRGSRLVFNPTTNITSLMICNIPNRFLKRRFMAILDQHCAQENAKLLPGGGDVGAAVVKSEYDFLYIPVDFSTGSNKGYAFVNMTTAAAARRLHAFLHGHRWFAAGSGKECEVAHSRIMGLDALVTHFSESLFPCGNKEFLPVRFDPPRDGVRRTAEHVVGCLVQPH